jgi:spore maturation protein CgeB
MRIFIINVDYDRFLSELYVRHLGLRDSTYDQQLCARDAALFGVSDFYPRRLRELGHEAVEVHSNNEALQRAWAREHGVSVPAGRTWQPAARVAGLSLPLPRANRWAVEILRAQIEDFKPDVVLTHDLQEPENGFWRWIKGRGITLVGQVASPLPRSLDPRAFDMILSSLPNFVESLRRAGTRAELFRLGFDPVVLERLGSRSAPEVGVSFVGSVSPEHSSRVSLLEQVAAEVDIAIHAHGANRLPERSPIRRQDRGEVWGIDMYRVLSRSAITLNNHIGIAGDYANNMRLYEATGVGTLLITDAKVNLRDMFEPDQEVVIYRDAQECVAKLRYYLSHPDDAVAIAAAGQRRTIREHTYADRMRQLTQILSNTA